MHAHVYFEKESQVSAERIREGLLLKSWCLFVGKLSIDTIGPHPQSQFEIHFLEEELLSAIRHLIFFREDHSVLFHRVSLNDFLDHTEQSFWLGNELVLDYSKLDPAGENKALIRFLENESV
jgi:DOPA 4,5-dioxygenase